jgi:hypothetical protein
MFFLVEAELLRALQGTANVPSKHCVTKLKKIAALARR